MNSESQPAGEDAARAHYQLGLPLPKGTRFRLAKRALYRVCWQFLREQIAFNRHISDALTELRERQKRVEEDTKALSANLERWMRKADREIGDHVARTQSDIASMQKAIVKSKSPAKTVPSSGRGPAPDLQARS